ncbi:MAG: IPT/TIG domain-containing protein [Candidatus Nealsonbacteria bacterium]
MTKKIITIWKKIRIWSLKRTRVLLIQVRRFFHLKRIRVLLVQIRRFLKKNIRLLKRQKKKLYKQIVSLILLIKNKIKSIESEYKEQRRKLKRVYKKELKFLAQRKSLGISFFNEQKKVVFHNKKIQKTYLFLFNLFKKINKKINKINYFLIKYKNLFIEIINDEKQVFKNLFNSIGNGALKLIDFFESYQKEMEKLFFQAVFNKAPKKANLIKNKAKKAISDYIHEYKKLSKKYTCDYQKRFKILERSLLKQRSLTIRFTSKKIKIIRYEFSKYKKEFIKERIKTEKEIKKYLFLFKKENKKIFLKNYKSFIFSFEEKKKLLKSEINHRRQLLAFIFKNINLKLFKFKIHFKLLKIRFWHRIVYKKERIKIKTKALLVYYRKLLFEICNDEKQVFKKALNSTGERVLGFMDFIEWYQNELGVSVKQGIQKIDGKISGAFSNYIEGVVKAKEIFQKSTLTIKRIWPEQIKYEISSKQIVSLVLIVVLILSFMGPIFNFRSESQKVKAAETVYSPTNNAAVVGGFTDPINAYSSNDSYATSLPNDDSHDYYDYNISLSGNSIDKVEVGYEACGDEKIAISVSWDGGGSNWSAEQVSSALSDCNGETVVYWDFTSATTWDDTKLNNTNFRVRVRHDQQGGPGTNSYDWIPVRITYTLVSPILNQRSYRWQNDNGANVNSNTNSANADTSLTMEKGERAIWRVQLDNTGTAAATSKVYKLQFKTFGTGCSAAETWYDATGTTAISYSLGLAGVNGDAISAAVTDTTSSCDDGCTGFTNGTWHENVSTSSAHTLDIDYNTEFGFMIETSNAAENTSYCLRLYNNTDTQILDNYSSYGQLSIVSSVTKRYSKTSQGSLPIDESDLTYYLDDTGYTAVATDDSSYDPATSSSAYPIFLFAEKHTNNTDDIDIDWDGQTTVACDINTVYLQAYNSNSSSWDNLATNTTCSANTDFLLEATIDTNPGYYYDASNWVYIRVYQASGNQTLKADYINVVFITPITFTQKDFRFYDNIDNIQPTTPKADENTAITNVATNDVLRLRMNIQIASSSLATSTQAFKLQYASTTATCDSGLNWYDTGAISSGTIWRGYNNTTPADGASITSSLLDSQTNKLETYEEENNSLSNPVAIEIGEKGEWDWVVEDNGAIANTDYCFRMVKSDDSVLNTYTNYPKLTTASTTLIQNYYRFYDNIDNIQPTTPKADENTAITNVATNDVLRIRTSIQIASSSLATSTQAFKLQYASTTATCDSGLNWYDTGAISSGTIWRGYNNTTPADGASITSSLLDSQTNKLETYEEENNSLSNPVAIEIGEKGEWDWVVEDNGASASTTYCFKMVKADGTALSVYTQYPKLITVSGPDATSFTNDTEPGLTDGGRINQQITVSGSNFGSSCSSPQSKVKIGSYSISCDDVSSWNSTNITFTIAPDINVFGGSNSNGLIVRANAVDDSSLLTFYIYPDITSLTTPQITNAAREYSSSDSDGIITINGNRFADSTGIITVLGESATVNSWADTAIAIRIPTSISDNSYTGNIVLTRSSDSKADNWTNFRILPRITSLSPSSAQAGESVVISGNHFCQSGTCPEQGNRASSSDKITINGVLVEDSKISVWTDTSITIEIPDDASSGNIIVRSNNYDSNSKSFTLTGEEEEVPEVTAPAPTHPSGEAPPEPEEEIPSPIIIDLLIADLKIRIINIQKEILRLQEELQKQILPEPEIEEPLPVPILPEIPEPPVVLPEPLFPPIEIEAPQVLKELGKEIIETTQDVIIKTSEIIDNITDFVGESFENIAERTQETTKSVTEFSRQTIKTVDKGISSTISEIKESRDSVIKNIIKQVQENTRKITQFSHQVIKVVDQGINLIIDRAAYFSDLPIRQLKSYQTYLQIPLQEKLLLEEKVVKKRAVPQPSVSPEIVRIDTIMVRSAFGNIDLDLIDKRAHVIAGKEIAVFIKPSKPISTLKGFLYFEKTSQIELKHTFYLPFISKVSAASVFAKTYEIQSFKFEGPDEKGFFKAILYMPPVTGEYKLGVDINFIDGTEKSVEKIVLVDPEGYIYEQLKRGELRIKGAKASLFVFDKSTDGYILWPAESYDQKNPQITDQTGQYSFLVPEGKYYIKVEQLDYEGYQSEAFEVREGEPIHFNIKLELKSFWQRILK